VPGASLAGARRLGTSRPPGPAPWRPPQTGRRRKGRLIMWGHLLGGLTSPGYTVMGMLGSRGA